MLPTRCMASPTSDATLAVRSPAERTRGDQEPGAHDLAWALSVAFGTPTQLAQEVSAFCPSCSPSPTPFRPPSGVAGGLGARVAASSFRRKPATPLRDRPAKVGPPAGRIHSCFTLRQRSLMDVLDFAVASVGGAGAGSNGRDTDRRIARDDAARREGGTLVARPASLTSVVIGGGLCARAPSVSNRGFPAAEEERRLAFFCPAFVAAGIAWLRTSSRARISCGIAILLAEALGGHCVMPLAATFLKCSTMLASPSFLRTAFLKAAGV